MREIPPRARESARVRDDAVQEHFSISDKLRPARASMSLGERAHIFASIFKDLVYGIDRRVLNPEPRHRIIPTQANTGLKWATGFLPETKPPSDSESVEAGHTCD